MSITYTEEQQQVIHLRDRNILVAAAAGSGKTAVLVERIIARLTKDEPPLNVDQLLIVTYTDAAASEMKERIHKAIEEALEKDTDNAHLRRQATLIHQAQITTIHKFCLSVIREYFHTIDIDPGFRVAEEGELKLLEKDVAEAVLESAYQEGNPEFTDFVESFASGKDDNRLDELVLELYKLSRRYPDPEKWLDSCARQYQISSAEELEKKSFVLDIMKEIHKLLGDVRELTEFGISICEKADGPTAYKAALTSDLMQIERLLEIDTFAEMQQAIREMRWESLARNKGKEISEKKTEQVKNLREQVKKIVKRVTEQYFFDDVSELQKDMIQAGKHMDTLVLLVKVFADAFSEEKKSKNLIDFDDMEQYALQILTREENGELVPSEAAESYQQKFAEVMIDEYQDSNLVQEAILTSVSGVSKGNYNIFMVGDVKQSIYRFRLSRPELFMEKYHTYSLESGKKQRIDLHKNFRSRREVLDSTNFVFEQIMMPEFGGIAYDDKAALHVGAGYEEKAGNETEILLLETPDSDAAEKIELEAAAIADRIKELMETHQVLDKETKEYRKLRYSDIVILSRSLKTTEGAIAGVLNEAGIPTYTGGREGYFQTREIQLALNYLKILDNPRQDIPFTAVLTSIFAGLTSEELAVVRSAGSGETMYECAVSYAETGGKKELRTRLSVFLETLERFRDRVPYMAIHALLIELFSETGYADYVGALPGGEQRAANLNMLIEKATAFEGTSYKGLFHFVRYIEQLQKYDIDYGEANVLDEKADLVCLMTIHKSKGLEFPVVFVAGTGRQFNMQDTRKSIVVHPELGIGIDVIDSVSRTKAPTLIKKAIQQRVQRESVAEELRVLYVAMTRAKEKLILTGAVSNPEKELAALSFLRVREEKELPYYNLANANKYMDWLLAALFRNPCFADILEEYEIDVPYQNPMFAASVPISVRKITEEALLEKKVEEVVFSGVTKEILKSWDTDGVYDAGMRQRLEEQLTYRYPHEVSRNVKQKLSVSEVKKKIYLEGEGEEAFKEEEVIPLLPKFLQEKAELTGASKGSAYHKLLEILDFTKDYDKPSLTGEILQKQQAGLLTEEMVSCIRVKEILSFLQSDVGRRVREASRRGTCFSEQPFVLGVEADRVYPDIDSGETVLIQGIIDVYFEEEDGLVVLDYKTDRVLRMEELKEKYHTQLDYYADALERLTGKRVKEKIIYSFALDQEMKV